MMPPPHLHPSCMRLLSATLSRFPSQQVVLSDTHLAGPEYPLFSETGQLDNTAITRTQQRFWRAVHAANAVRPPASLALFAGDVV